MQRDYFGRIQHSCRNHEGDRGFTSFYAGLFAPLRCDFSPYSDRLVNLASIQLQPSENIMSRLMAPADIL